MTDAFGKRLTLPRGGTQRLRDICKDHGITLKWVDARQSAPVEFNGFRVDPNDPAKVPRWYQQEILHATFQKQQGVIRAPTGSGKTYAAFMVIAAMGQRALVIVNDGNLASQWIREGSKCLDIPIDEIGVIGMGKGYRPGPRLTVALCQSLYRKGNKLSEVLEAHPFGIVIIDEAQSIAARTFQEAVGRIPAKYRYGFSADETRRDNKQFLIYDEIGEVLYEVPKKKLETQGVILDVKIRVVPTNFRADWYAHGDVADRDFTALVAEMVEDEERNDLILQVARMVKQYDEAPCILFTHRREHAETLGHRMYVEEDMKAGTMLGGSGADRERFERMIGRLTKQDIDFVATTFEAFGVGHDVPAIRSGMITTPISAKNPQFFGQVRGRVCRPSPGTGKTAAVVYYMLDEHVFPGHIGVLKKWCNGNLEVFRRGRWVRS